MRLACLPLYLRCLPESEERKESRKRGIKDTMMFLYPQLRQCLHVYLANIWAYGYVSSIVFCAGNLIRPSDFCYLFSHIVSIEFTDWGGCIQVEKNPRITAEYVGLGNRSRERRRRRRKNLSPLFLYSHHFGVYAFHVWISTGGMLWDWTPYMYVGTINI